MRSKIDITSKGLTSFEGGDINPYRYVPTPNHCLIMENVELETIIARRELERIGEDGTKSSMVVLIEMPKQFTDSSDFYVPYKSAQEESGCTACSMPLPRDPCSQYGDWRCK